MWNKEENNSKIIFGKNAQYSAVRHTGSRNLALVDWTAGLTNKRHCEREE